MNIVPQRAAASDAMVNTPSVFARQAELATLREHLAARRSLLLHGEAGAGKTLLLSVLRPELPSVLYSPQNGTPQQLYRNLLAALMASGNQELAGIFPGGMQDAQRKTAVAVRGIVREILNNSKYVIVLDHLARPSQSLAASIRELKVNCSVPVVAVSRSQHMEDAGFVLQLFPERREKLALRNFDRKTAAEFATRCAQGQGLAAANLQQFLDAIVDHSDGNPGAIQQMVSLATQPKYAHGDSIKIAPLYIDYKLTTVTR
jgi:hypothetical protein